MINIIESDNFYYNINKQIILYKNDLEIISINNNQFDNIVDFINSIDLSNFKGLLKELVYLVVFENDYKIYLEKDKK